MIVKRIAAALMASALIGQGAMGARQEIADAKSDLGTKESVPQPVKGSMDASGTIHVPAFLLPESSLRSQKTRERHPPEWEKDIFAAFAALADLPLSGAGSILDPREHPYFKGVDPNDPLAFPIRSAELLSKFPPSLLISSMRDQGLSSVAYMHSRLTASGVDAKLHVWEGLVHGFFFDPDLPESREVYDVAVKFFGSRLGRNGASTSLPTAAPASELEETLQGEVERFVAHDKQSPPEPCQAVFVGSSSIVLWKSLEEDMAPLQVINRGFGGSHIEYVNRWLEQLIALHRPSAIVLYAGENDIAADKPPERVIADFDTFMDLPLPFEPA